MIEMKDTDKKTSDKETEFLSTNVNDFSDAEIDDMLAFIDRVFGSNCSYSIFVISRDKKFAEAEVIVLFEDEFFLRQRFKNHVTIHNDNLGMESELEYVWDAAVSIRKSDISAVEISRPPMCGCNACTTSRDKGQKPEQPEHYELEIATPSKQYKIKIECMEDGFGIQEAVREWLFEKPAKKRKVKK